MERITNPEYAKLQANFTQELRNKGRSEATVIAYAKDIEQLLNYFASRGVLRITDSSITELEAYKKHLQDNNYTPKSISRKINSTRTFYRYLLESSVITDNPAEKLAHPKFETKPPRVLTEMEYRALRDVSRVDIRLYSIVEVLLQTGIRIGELAALSVEDLRNTKEGIDFLYIKPSGSHNARKVPINKSAKKAIQEYLDIRPEIGRAQV